MKKPKIEQGKLMVVPGQRLRVTYEGTVRVGDESQVEMVLDDGSIWWMFPKLATIEVIDP